MGHSTLAALLLATPFPNDTRALADVLLKGIERITLLVQRFRQQPVTPLAAADFENQLEQLLLELGRSTTDWTYNSLEPGDPEAVPKRLLVDDEVYRRRGKHPRDVATLFGTIRLRRYLYEPLEPGLPCLHPLQLQLGLQAGCATAALAGRVGLWATQHPQRAVLEILKREYDVHWSQQTLRTVTASLAAGRAAGRQGTQCARLLRLLSRAHASPGKGRIVLAVGRDGIHLPLRREQYKEGSTSTLTVYDRRGRRLGTVYLGQMPEEGQVTLSGQLTALIQQVLKEWDGPRPRLAYITDGGWHPSDYYRTVLRRMEDPRRPGRALLWERVIDYYHAAEYVTRLAEALFGDRPCGRAWGRRMRKRLKDPAGLTRVLQSASYQYNQRRLPSGREKAFWSAYGYLRRHRRWMDYARYRREGIPLGSGVTEAACKTVFAQRLKQSGMKWDRPGGQTIVDLRVLVLSGVWDEAYRLYVGSKAPRFEYTARVCTAPEGAEAA